MAENEWRLTNCAEGSYSELYCEAPFACEGCAGAWTCDDIYNITIEIITYVDTNNDA
jgi:hypothetical protein